MGSIGAAEILIVLVVALFVLGPDKLPEAARQIGKGMRDVRKFTGGWQNTVQGFIDDPESIVPAAERIGFTSKAEEGAEPVASAESVEAVKSDDPMTPVGAVAQKPVTAPRRPRKAAAPARAAGAATAKAKAKVGAKASEATKATKASKATKARTVATPTRVEV